MIKRNITGATPPETASTENRYLLSFLHPPLLSFLGSSESLFEGNVIGDTLDSVTFSFKDLVEAVSIDLSGARVECL